MNEHVNNKQATYSYIKNRLEGKKDSYGMLMKEIVRSGIFTHCSACCAVCDVLEWDPNTHEPKLIGKCTGCGICVDVCPVNAIEVNQQAVINDETCTGCVACVSECPSEAIVIAQKKVGK